MNAPHLFKRTKEAFWRIASLAHGRTLFVLGVIVIAGGAFFYFQNWQIGAEKDILDECRFDSIPEMHKCFKEKLSALVEHKDPREALLVLERAKDVRPDLYNNAHFIGHGIGKAAYDHFGNVSEALAAADGIELNIGTVGYYHHVLIEYVQQNFSVLRSGQALAESSCEVMASDPKRKQFVPSCYHGLGHGLVAVLDFDLPRALEQCDSLIYKNGQLACYDGAFMENALLALASDRTDYHAVDHPFFKKDDPSYPCRKIGEKYRNACYFNAILQYFVMNKEPANQSRPFYDVVSAAFALCRRVPEENRPHCFGGVAVNGAYIVGWDAEKVREICLRGESSDEVRFCVISAASRYWQVGKEAASRFCEIVPTEYIDECKKRVVTPFL